MQFGIWVLSLTTMLFGGYGFVLNLQQHEPLRKITEAEIKSAINSRSDVDECDSLDQIHIDHLEYHDFFGDGQQQAVVVASTCMTGTAGPDIHAVYKRDAQDKVVELPFRHAEGDPFFNHSGWKIPVFGNRNYGLAVEDGELVARWNDSSDREAPLVVWYKWDGKEFVVDHMKVEGPFPTSYDCAKAMKELDRAIYYSPSVAALDVQMEQVYGTLLQELPPDGKQALQGQQREWLARREKECTIYKWWVDCLTNLYTKRIAELKQRSIHVALARIRASLLEQYSNSHCLSQISEPADSSAGTSDLRSMDQFISLCSRATRGQWPNAATVPTDFLRSS